MLNGHILLSKSLVNQITVLLEQTTADISMAYNDAGQIEQLKSNLFFLALVLGALEKLLCKK